MKILENAPEQLLKNIETIRKSKKLSKLAFAKLMNMEGGTYSRIENGERGLSVYRLYEIARALDVPITEIIDYKANSVAKAITGFNTSNEAVAYEKGRHDEQSVTMDFILNWKGSTNSAMGTVLATAYKRLKKIAKDLEFLNI